MASETAQDTFARMLSDEIAPELRAIGFKGSGRVFDLISDGYWALVGFQKNYYSNSELVTFTINLTVASKAAWAAGRVNYPYIGAKPSGNTRYSSEHTGGAETVRIGLLMPDGEDTWWEVRAGKPTDRLTAEIVVAIERYAVPWLRSRMAPTEGG